jgi:hypothetical protein
VFLCPDDSARHAAAGWILPQLASRRTLEGVETGFRSSAEIDICAGNNPIGCDEYVAVKKVLRRVAAHVRFPLHLAGLGVQLAKHAVARPHVDAVARDRGRMRESPTCFKLPEELCRRWRLVPRISTIGISAPSTMIETSNRTARMSVSLSGYSPLPRPPAVCRHFWNPPSNARASESPSFRSVSAARALVSSAGQLQ